LFTDCGTGSFVHAQPRLAQHYQVSVLQSVSMAVNIYA
jgi:hypothetical protein